jgi:hypothetical protein
VPTTTLKKNSKKRKEQLKDKVGVRKGKKRRVQEGGSHNHSAQHNEVAVNPNSAAADATVEKAVVQ